MSNKTREALVRKMRPSIKEAVEDFNPADYPAECLPGLWVELLGTTITEAYLDTATDEELVDVWADMNTTY